MNGLTVNLHLMMLAFYQPKGKRTKILIEDHAFPSDRYAVRSLLKVKGVSEDSFLSVKPRPGEDTIRTVDIVKTIQDNRDSLALVMLSGVQYYTGQLFDIATITAAGQVIPSSDWLTQFKLCCDWSGGGGSGWLGPGSRRGQRQAGADQVGRGLCRVVQLQVSQQRGGWHCRSLCP